MDDQQTPGGPAVPRVIDRLRAAWLSDERIQKYFRAGVIRLDGQQVTDLEQLARRRRARSSAPS